MPVRHTMPITLDELFGVIKRDPSLGVRQKLELRSAIATFSRVVARTPSEIVADPGAIRRLAADANWQMADLKKASWENTLSRLTKAMKMAGIAVHRRRANYTLSTDWVLRLDLIMPRDRRDLRRFGGWCSLHGITPDLVGDDTFEKYFAFLQQESILRNPRERWHEARRAWNRCMAGPEPSHAIPVGPDPSWRGLTWRQFPGSMQEDVAAYRRWAVEADVFEDERRVLKPVTADGYIRGIRCMISRLIEAGKPVDHFTSLDAILDPGLVKDGLRLIKGTRTLDQARPSLHSVMTAVLSVAKFKKVEPARYAEFKALADKVRHRPQGMNSKNKLRLAALRSDDARQRLFELPVQVARRLAGKHQPDHPRGPDHAACLHAGTAAAHARPDQKIWPALIWSAMSARCP